ncbi:MAG: MerR family transcriptional regulator [Rhodanobacteraceae bacterium]|nr:MerR family transcriptional regulator [Rhodanobacteraceae bacterium]
MLDPGSNSELPPIPAKRYFTIGEVSELCGVKPHVLRYWEQEFPSLKPVKRRGNRRYYQRHDVLMIRQIRSLLYEQGFTIGGARQRLDGDARQAEKADKSDKSDKPESKVSAELLRQMRVDLEAVLEILRV